MTHFDLQLDAAISHSGHKWASGRQELAVILSDMNDSHSAGKLKCVNQFGTREVTLVSFASLCSETVLYRAQISHRPSTINGDWHNE